MNALSALFRAEPTPNARRFDGQRGHVESYFLRLNHPSQQRAVWLKQTILAPLSGEAIAESWVIFFDGQKVVAEKATVPWAQARYDDPQIETPSMKLAVGAEGSARGEIAPVRFDFTWRSAESSRPLELFPYRLLRVGPFPRSKLNTPAPSIIASGAVHVAGEHVDITGWTGSQGHNWGREHSFEYAWGQAVFPEQDAFLEGFTGRVRFAGRTTPRMSALIVRHAGRELRFDRIFDPWRQEQHVETDRWEIRLRSNDGEAHLVMDSRDRGQACLGYLNPDGAMSYCFNSKLASVALEVRPSDGASFTLKSEHGGALEFLRREPDPRFTRVV
ncbi:MAG: hypothetical protein QM817_09430 [Archangium sp.]